MISMNRMVEYLLCQMRSLLPEVASNLKNNQRNQKGFLTK